MSQKYEKLKTLLKELFQLDQPDLDFGLYRVMHAKSAEVSQFLDKDLLPQVQAAFGQYKTADKAEIEKELAKAIEQAKALGADPETLPKVKDLRARLKSDAVDVGALESEVYDRLFGFFRRYYSEGDFLAKRVYKPGVYAIPYEGEEVTLHWANKDQYYIKTSEYLRDYAFRLRPGDDKKPMRVHFRLADAAEGEHGNVKAAEGKDRVFILVAPGDSGHDFIAEEDGDQGKDLVIRFEYRPATSTDWHEDDREGKSKPPAQKDLSSYAVKRVLAVTGISLAAWIAEFGKPHITASGEKADYTRLEAHIKRYTARNTFDYFIHKDLGGFLRRELDFYIKNEVMHLDDVENETAPRVEQYLSKIKMIRKIAGKIIDFLAQLEDFQKKLWLKKKFVVGTQYCITLDHIPETFYVEIAANDAQREEWIRLFAIDEIKGDMMTPGYSKKLKLEFLKAHPTLVVDTRNFDAGFIARLLEAMGDVDEQIDGNIFHSENFQALNLIHARYREQVKCIYIDPPYNTGSGDFAYKDSYQHSSWLAMMKDRLILSHGLLADDGSHYCQIDSNESSRLRELLDFVFLFQREIIWDIQVLSGFKTIAPNWIRGHETIYFHTKSGNYYFNKIRQPHTQEYLDSFTQVDGQGRHYMVAHGTTRYRDEVEKKGKPFGDVWSDVMSFQQQPTASERIAFATQKPEKLIERIMLSASVKGDMVLDYFGGSGTTGATALELGRKFILVEMGDYFDEVTVPRVKSVLFGKQTNVARDNGYKGGGIVKIIRLESYEDTLNNLETPLRTDTQQLMLNAADAQGPDSLKEQYLLRYMLDVETRGSQSLLNVQAIADPTAYKLKVKCPGSDESREVDVDLLETFNWLLGLTVQHIAAPQSLTAAFERDSEKRLRLKGRLKQETSGPYWFRTVTGTMPDGRKTLIIWRKLTGEPEQDNLVLDEWFTKQGYSAKDSEFGLIYVNGDNNLENLKAPDDTWKVRLIEEDFCRLMFDTEGV